MNDRSSNKMSVNGSEPRPCRPSGPQMTGILRRARLTTWWIFNEVRDPEALKLFEQARKQGGSGQKTGQRLESALPQWCRGQPLQRELCGLIAAKFRMQSEVSQSAVDEIRTRIEKQCFDYTRRKYGECDRAREFGRSLATVAWSQLDLGFLPQARGAYAILVERERELRQREKNIIQFFVLAQKLNLRAILQSEIHTYLRQEPDPILDLLRQFFSIKDGYWRRFFDNRGHERRKKLPNFPSMRARLVERLCNPRSVGTYPAGFKLTRPEALEIAADCIKAAYPSRTPRSLDGDSIRVALQYKGQMESRSVVQRPRYNRI
jgi:hypothetical protein